MKISLPEILMLLTCLTVIVAAGYAFSNDGKKASAPEVKRRNIPVAHFYNELIGIVFNAKEIGHLYCITALLNEFYVEYHGRMPEEEIEAYMQDVIDEKNKRMRQIIANKVEQQKELMLSTV